MTLENRGAGGGDKSPPRKHRLNIILSHHDKERMDRLVELLGADTATEVTKDALRILEFFANKNESGAKIYIQEAGENAPTKVELFGLSA